MSMDKTSSALKTPDCKIMMASLCVMLSGEFARFSPYEFCRLAFIHGATPEKIISALQMLLRNKTIILNPWAYASRLIDG